MNAELKKEFAELREVALPTGLPHWLKSYECKALGEMLDTSGGALGLKRVLEWLQRYRTKLRPQLAETLVKLEALWRFPEVQKLFRDDIRAAHNRHANCSTHAQLERAEAP
jgi:hypothetical protein